MNEPCTFHVQQDALSGSLGIQSIRCAHAGDEYICERYWPAAEARWIIRSTMQRGTKPELRSASIPTEADRIWTEMERRMLAGEPFGQPY